MDEATTNDDLEQQYPVAVEGGEEEAVEQEEQQPEAGTVLVRYVESTNHMRGLTLKDQVVDLYVPRDEAIDNSVEAKPRGLEGALEKGLWFTAQNRWTVDMSGASKILLDYLEGDASFEVKRY
jgi:hypothetical protein